MGCALISCPHLNLQAAATSAAKAKAAKEPVVCVRFRRVEDGESLAVVGWTGTNAKGVRQWVESNGQ